MARKYTDTRKIGGKTYYYEGTHAGKFDAQRHAYATRKLGCQCSVVKLYGWSVFCRSSKGGRCPKTAWW